MDSNVAELPVLTSSAINDLRDLARNDPQLVWASPFGELQEQLSLEMVSLPIEFDPYLDLDHGGADRLIVDVSNAARVGQMFPGMTPATALDERVWATLAFGKFKDYAVTRWPPKSNNPHDLREHIANKLFAANVRVRVRDHAIGRLWWAHHYAERVPLATDTALEFVFHRAEIISQLMGRPSLFNNDVVLASTINVLHSQFSSGVEYERALFREFMVAVDLLAGGLSLGTMDHPEVEVLLQGEFDRVWFK